MPALTMARSAFGSPKMRLFADRCLTKIKPWVMGVSSYFPAQNSRFGIGASSGIQWRHAKTKAPPLVAAGPLVTLLRMGVPVLPRRFLTYGATNIDEIIGDHAEPDPALHSVLAFIPTTVEPVSPLGHADAAFAAGPPFLAVTEPALLLLAPALSALGGAVGDADALDALGFGSVFVLAGIEGRIGSHQVRHASGRRLVEFDRGNEQV